MDFLHGTSIDNRDILLCKSINRFSLNRGCLYVYDYNCKLKFCKKFDDCGVYNLKCTKVDTKYYYSYLRVGSRRLDRIITGCNPAVLDICDNKFNVIKSDIKLLPAGSLSTCEMTECHDYKLVDLDHYYLLGHLPLKVNNIPGIDHDVWIVNNIIQEQKDGKVVGQFETKDYPELYKLSMFRNDYANELYHEKCCDYAHLNSFDITSDNKYVYISYRNIGVIKVEKKTKKIVTYVCHKLNSNYFIGQHDLRLIDNNTFSVFNNNALYPAENVGDKKSQIVICYLNNNSVTEYKVIDTSVKASCSLGGAVLVDKTTNTWDIVYSPYAGKKQVQEYCFNDNLIHFYANLNFFDFKNPGWCYRIERAPLDCTYRE